VEGRWAGRRAGPRATSARAAGNRPMLAALGLLNNVVRSGRHTVCRQCRAGSTLVPRPATPAQHGARARGQAASAGGRSALRCTEGSHARGATALARPSTRGRRSSRPAAPPPGPLTGVCQRRWKAPTTDSARCTPFCAWAAAGQGGRREGDCGDADGGVLRHPRRCRAPLSVSLPAHKRSHGALFSHPPWIRQDTPCKQAYSVSLAAYTPP
jgi:hypothetical protein